MTLECKCGRKTFIPIAYKFCSHDATGERVTVQARGENMWEEGYIGRVFLGEMWN